MDRYVKQLIEDLRAICNLPIPLPFVEIPPEMQDFPEVAEFELGPGRTVVIDHPAFVNINGVRWSSCSGEDWSKRAFFPHNLTKKISGF